MPTVEGRPCDDADSHGREPSGALARYADPAAAKRFGSANFAAMGGMA